MKGLIIVTFGAAMLLTGSIAGHAATKGASSMLQVIKQIAEALGSQAAHRVISAVLAGITPGYKMKHPPTRLGRSAMLL